MIFPSGDRRRIVSRSQLSRTVAQQMGVDMEMHTEMSKTDSPSQSELHSDHDIGDHYEIPAPEPFTSFGALKDRIRRHYELCSDYYYSLW